MLFLNVSQVTAVCDWVMLTCMKDRDYYAKHKFIHLNQKVDNVPLVSKSNLLYTGFIF